MSVISGSKMLHLALGLTIAVIIRTDLYVLRCDPVMHWKAQQ